MGSCAAVTNTLGFSGNLQKSLVIASQQFSILGLEICSVSGRSHLSKHRVVAFHRCLSQVQLGRRLHFRQIVQLTSMMSSMIAVVPLGLLMIRAFQRWTLSHQLCVPRHLQIKLAIMPSYVTMLLPWKEPGMLHLGSPIERVSFPKVVSTNASLLRGVGWGVAAMCNGAIFRGLCNVGSTSTIWKCWQPFWL